MNSLRIPSRLRAACFHVAHPTAPVGFPELAGRDLAGDIEREFAPILQSYALDAERFFKFKTDCGYADDYVRYMGPDLLNEKLLEHFVSLDLLGWSTGDSFGPLIDVGAAVSPFADYVARRFGVQAYRLDLDYPPGVNGANIGAPADSIPLPDDSVGAMTLHCTIDHFEADADTGFIREAARVLRPGGRVCVLPVYLSDQPWNICDPRRFTRGIGFDREAHVRGVLGYSNRFGRFYSLETLRRRVLDAAPERLGATLFKIEGDQPKVPNNYLHYALVLEKRS